MNIKVWYVQVEDMNAKLAKTENTRPILYTAYVEAATRSDAMDNIVWSEIEGIRAILGENVDYKAVAKSRRIRISAHVSHSVTAVGHDGLTRAERDKVRAERKAARKAAREAKKAAKREIIAKDGRAVAIPDGAKQTARAKARPTKAA